MRFLITLTEAQHRRLEFLRIKMGEKSWAAVIRALIERG